tara:strand:+ start:91 stop:543 length:453 start_codon:yes stop_codon:yes gene_type:complete
MEVKDAVISFEAKMIALRKKADGDELVLFIHLDEEDRRYLWDLHLTTRFMCGLVEIGDDEQPIVPEEIRVSKKAVAVAGQMCREPEFQTWIIHKAEAELPYIAGVIDEENAVRALKHVLNIESRADLSRDEEARDNFRELIREYQRMKLV